MCRTGHPIRTSPSCNRTDRPNIPALHSSFKHLANTLGTGRWISTNGISWIPNDHLLFYKNSHLLGDPQKRRKYHRALHEPARFRNVICACQFFARTKIFRSYQVEIQHNPGKTPTQGGDPLCRQHDSLDHFHAGGYPTAKFHARRNSGRILQSVPEDTCRGTSSSPSVLQRHLSENVRVVRKRSRGTATSLPTVNYIPTNRVVVHCRVHGSHWTFSNHSYFRQPLRHCRQNTSDTHLDVPVLLRHFGHTHHFLRLKSSVSHYCGIYYKWASRIFSHDFISALRGLFWLRVGHGHIKRIITNL